MRDRESAVCRPALRALPAGLSLLLMPWMLLIAGISSQRVLGQSAAEAQTATQKVSAAEVTAAEVTAPEVTAAEARPTGDARDQPIFLDWSERAGLDFVYWNGMTGARHLVEIVGNGAALFDYDNDGDLDLFMVQGARIDDASLERAPIAPPERPGDRLWRNDLGSGESAVRLVEVSLASGVAERAAGPLTTDGYGIGVATGDIDNDGWIDLYITRFGANRLLRNRGDGTFEDLTAVSGTGDSGFSVSASFADVDRDGLLDLYVANYVQLSPAIKKVCRSMTGVIDYCGPVAFKPEVDTLYRNLGGGRFEDISARSGIGREPAAGLGVVARDFDADGWVDFYVANDGAPNQLWVNQGDGSFANEALFAGAAVNELGRSEASMGIAAGDFDGDGDDDLLLTHLVRETNTLYRNQGDGFFEDYSSRTGIARNSWNFTSFGAAFLDYDNDGTAPTAAIAPGTGASVKVLVSTRSPCLTPTARRAVARA